MLIKLTTSKRVNPASSKSSKGVLARGKKSCKRRNVFSRAIPDIRAQANPALPPQLGQHGVDPYTLLLKQRIVFFGGEVTDFSSDAAISQLLLLDAQDPGKDIKMFINSPGGSVTAGMGVYDTMQMCRSDISTCVFGIAASMGAFLLGAGARGKRQSMANSRIMIHQPLGGAQGDLEDIQIQVKEIMYHKANLNRIMANYTGQKLNQIEKDCDRDYYMSPVDALNYGIIDHIVGGPDATLKLKGNVNVLPPIPNRFRNNPYLVGYETYKKQMAMLTKERIDTDLDDLEEAVEMRSLRFVDPDDKIPERFRVDPFEERYQNVDAMGELLDEKAQTEQEAVLGYRPRRFMDPIRARRMVLDKQQTEDYNDAQEQLREATIERLRETGEEHLILDNELVDLDSLDKPQVQGVPEGFNLEDAM